MSEPIRVLIVDDDYLFRRELAWYLIYDRRFRVVGIAASAEEGYRLADAEMPDAALVGTTLPDGPSLKAASEMRRRFPALPTIVVTADESDDELFAAIRAGASAYCGKAIAEDRLVRVIERVATGEYAIGYLLMSRPQLAARILEQFRTAPANDRERFQAPPYRPDAPLSERELELRQFIARPPGQERRRWPRWRSWTK